MAFCMECGAKLEGSDKFCMNCGTPVPSAAAPMLEIEQHGNNNAAQVPAEAPFPGAEAPALADGPTLLQTKPLELKAAPSASEEAQAPFPGAVSSPEIAAPRTRPLEINANPEVASSAPAFSAAVSSDGASAAQTKPLEINDAPPAPFSGTPFPGTADDNVFQAPAAASAPEPETPAASAVSGAPFADSSSNADLTRSSLPKADVSSPFSNPASKAPEPQLGTSISADDIFGSASSSSSPKVEVQASSSDVPVFGAGNAWNNLSSSQAGSAAKDAGGPFASSSSTAHNQNESSWPPSVKRTPEIAADQSDVEKPSLGLWYAGLVFGLFLCCCNVFCLPGFIFASKCDKKWKAGDVEGALSDYLKVKIFTFVAIVLGVLFDLGAIAFFIFAGNQ